MLEIEDVQIIVDRKRKLDDSPNSSTNDNSPKRKLEDEASASELGGQSSADQLSLTQIKQTTKDGDSSIQCKKQSVEPTFVMQWTNRDDLIRHLNQFSLFLSGKTISDGERMKINELNHGLRSILTNLPFKEPVDHCTGTISTRVPALEIDNYFRIKVVDHLTKNEDYLLTDDDTLTDEEKKRLVIENNFINQALQNLHICSVAEQTEYGGQGFIGKPARLVENEVPKKKVTQSEFATKTELAELKTELELIKTQVWNTHRHLILGRSEVVFNHELYNVREFFENGLTSLSENFYCQGIYWYIQLKAKTRESDKSTHLEFYLHISERNNLRGSWQCKAEFTLKLLSYLPNGDKVREFDHTFTKLSGRGSSRFISYEDLQKPANAFIKNDQLIVQVYLKAGRLFRL